MRVRGLRAFVLLAGLLGASPAIRADGDCTPRPATAAEVQSYSEAYSLFLRVAPEAPEGWSSHDSPDTGAMPRLCQEFGNEPIRRHFDRRFVREQGRQQREDEAVQGYAALAENLRARQRANKAKIDAIDAEINALTAQVQQAAAAQRFGEIESLNRQMDALAQQKVALMGLDESDAQAKQIEATQTRDTDASFVLRFETPNSEPRTGRPYRVAAGQGLVNSYDDGNGNPIDDVRVYFGGAPQQARVTVTGDPERVRALVDGADLKAIAAFR